MSLSARQERYLAKIAQLVAAIQTEAKKAEGKVGNSSGKRRKRRSAEDAAKMRATILAERAKGTSAAKLASKYGVSLSLIHISEPTRH